MNTALVIVDVQRDFCEGGSLAVAGGSSVAAKIAELLHVPSQWDFIVATRDFHQDPGSHFSDQPDYTDSWPAHCVAGTDGAEFHPNLDTSFLDVQFLKGRNAAAYSGFEGFLLDDEKWSLEEWLDGKDVERLDICGIALDYCVKATALDAVKLGYETRVLVPLTVSVHPDRADETLAVLKNAGVDLVYDVDMN